MREAVAKENGFSLYRQYGEAQAADFIKVDLSTLMRWRRKGLVPFINMGERKIRYFGYQIADVLLKGTECLNMHDENSKSVNIGSPKEMVAPLGTGLPTTTKLDA